MENSHIEPSELYGTQSLDTLRPLIVAWTGRSIEMFAILPSTYAVKVDQLIPAFTAPDRNSDVIAILEPETNYSLLGEDSGLYAVWIDGWGAYVPFNLIRFVPQ